MTRSLNMRRLLAGVLFLAALSFLATPSFGQLGDADLTDAELRDTTLLWLDQFLTETQLLRQEDLAKIRAGVEQMSPSQLRQWLEQTKQLREYVESERWQQTKVWLREFLRVQAIYSEEEIQGLRDEIVQADANQILAILKRIQSRHDALVWMRQAKERNREVEVMERDAYMAQQAVAADSARGAPSPAPLYGAGSGTAQKPSKGYGVPYRMIDSRTMSRAAVWAELWGPGFLIGF
jgi:hypothetical protein